MKYKFKIITIIVGVVLPGWQGPSPAQLCGGLGTSPVARRLKNSPATRMYGVTVVDEGVKPSHKPRHSVLAGSPATSPATWRRMQTREHETRGSSWFGLSSEIGGSDGELTVWISEDRREFSFWIGFSSEQS